MNSQFDYKLGIEAVAGPGFAGDIAIDDVSVTNGWCIPEEGCDFEGKHFVLLAGKS